MNEGKHYNARAQDRELARVRSGAFSWPIRVYYEDTDAGQIVYHARYLHFMERARTEWLRHIGIEQGVVRQQHGIVFVVIESHLNWHKPARYNDELEVSVENVTVGRASLSFEQRIWRKGDEAKKALVTATVRAAAIKDGGLAPTRMPLDIHQQFVLGSQALAEI